MSASENPFTASDARSSGVAPAWNRLGRAALLALPVTLVTVAARVYFPVDSVPVLSPVSVGVGAALLLGAAIAGFLGTRKVEWLWPVCFALPLALFALDLGPGTELAVHTFREQAIGFVWMASFDAFALWLWLDGPRRPGVPFTTFAAAMGVLYQAVQLGWQCIVPGMALSAAFALVPIALTRRSDGWLPAAVRDAALVWPAWLVAFLAGPVSVAVGACCLVLVTREPRDAALALLGLSGLGPPLTLAVELAEFASWGVLLAAAGVVGSPGTELEFAL